MRGRGPFWVNLFSFLKASSHRAWDLLARQKDCGFVRYLHNAYEGEDTIPLTCMTIFNGFRLNLVFDVSIIQTRF